MHFSQSANLEEVRFTAVVVDTIIVVVEPDIAAAHDAEAFHLFVYKAIEEREVSLYHEIANKCLGDRHAFCHAEVIKFNFVDTLDRRIWAS